MNVVETRSFIGSVAVCLAFGSADLSAADGGRQAPAPCAEAAPLDREDRTAGSAEARWNAAYLEGIRALDLEDLDGAHDAFCRAAQAGLGFEPRDWRYAETLDELGLIAFLSGDLERAEAMQGAAVAEMLLALGPGDAVASEAPGRDGRLSSVAIYAARLNWIFQAQERAERVEDPVAHPDRFLASSGR